MTRRSVHFTGALCRILAWTAVLLLAAGAPPAARAAPITFNTALAVAEGEGIFRIQARSFTFDDLPAPGRDLRVRAVPLVGVYGLSADWTLFAIAPWLDKELEVETPAGRRTRGGSGVGDTTLLARWTAWRRDAPGKTLRVAPFAGLELPTGDDDATDALGRLPQPLQLGSGSWDVPLGVIVTRQTLDRQVDGALSYTINTEAQGYQIGDTARLDLSYQHRLLPRELGRSDEAAGVPAFLYGVLDSNLVWRERDERAGVERANTGGTTWFLAPGLQWVHRRWVLEGAVQIPVVQDPNGAGREADLTTTLSFRMNF